MFTFLQRPYPFEKSAARKLRASFLFGLFVILFLYGFQPFGMVHMGDRTLPVAIGFGIVCSAAMLLFSFGFVALLPRVFDEARWTVFRECCWVLFHCLFISLLNAFYAMWVGMADYSLNTVASFGLYTVAIGIFPISISILITEAQLSRKYVHASENLNAQLDQPESETGTTAEIVLQSDNKNEDLHIRPDRILFLEAADNYVSVVFEAEDGTTRRHLLRATMKALEEQLAPSESFLRVHKSYLVNYHRIAHVSGNAQGYKLHFAGVEERLPVSRKQNEALRERLSFRP